MSARRGAMQSEYLHWAKTQPPARYNLASSEVSHYRLDRLPLSIADLELDGASYFRYPPLREAIAARYGAPPDCVVTVDGTSMANMLAMAALIEPGDEILAEHPTYEPMLAAARFLGGEVTRFHRRSDDGFGLDPNAVEQALTERTRLIMITNLHNPSSALAEEEALRRLGGLGPTVLVDEVYLDSAFAAAPKSAFHLGANFVCTNSLTKVYGLSGLRCGWILAAPELAEKMWRLNDLFGVSQPHPAERLSCIAFAHLDEIAAGTGELLKRNRALADTFFADREELDIVMPDQGTTLFTRLRSGRVDSLHTLLRDKYDTAIVPGRWFEMPDYFRIGLAGPTEVLEAGLERLGEALDELR